MKNCIIIIGSAFRDEAHFDFIKKGEDEVDIISIDYIELKSRGVETENKNGKIVTIYRQVMDIKNPDKLNELKKFLLAKAPYERIIILDSVHFDKQFEYSRLIVDKVINEVFPGHAYLYQIHYISPRCASPTLNGQPLQLTREIVSDIKRNVEYELARAETDLSETQTEAINRAVENMLKNNPIIENLYRVLNSNLRTWKEIPRCQFLYNFFKDFQASIMKICDEYYQNNLTDSLEKIDLKAITETRESQQTGINEGDEEYKRPHPG